MEWDPIGSPVYRADGESIARQKGAKAFPYRAEQTTLSRRKAKALGAWVGGRGGCRGCFWVGGWVELWVGRCRVGIEWVSGAMGGGT